jgi:hypothetical protein
MAYVNAGRWVVGCPFPGCNSAQMASFTDRRFFCCDCANAAVGGQWVEVVWPANHTEVENWVASRPFDVRHWFPGETAEDIRRQDDEAMGKAIAPRPVAPPVDTSAWPRKTTLSIDGEERTVPVLHYGTPEWDKAQKAGGTPTAKELEQGAAK